ncbi:MAG: biotin carboxylase N-terminal domain-containing protein, partial [Gammaproteobacteria bacterium]
MRQRLQQRAEGGGAAGVGRRIRRRLGDRDEAGEARGSALAHQQFERAGQRAGDGRAAAVDLRCRRHAGVAQLRRQRFVGRCAARRAADRAGAAGRVHRRDLAPLHRGHRAAELADVVDEAVARPVQHRRAARPDPAAGVDDLALGRVGEGGRGDDQQVAGADRIAQRARGEVAVVQAGAVDQRVLAGGLVGRQREQGLAAAQRAGAAAIHPGYGFLAESETLIAACETAGIDPRTLQRWQAGEGLVSGDGRPQAVRPVPSHALSEAERTHLLA